MLGIPLNRRRAGAWLYALSALSALAPAVAHAQAGYPNRPIRLMVPYPAGGALDAVARAVSDPLQQRLGQPVVIENRAGAGARLGTEVVVRAPGDGYSLLIVTPGPISVAPALVPGLSYEPLKDLIPVMRLSEIINVMVIPDSLPVKTVGEFIAWAKKQNRPISFGSSGVGSADHLAGEFFKQMTGLDLVHIPYKGGGPAMQDLATARIDVSFATYAAAGGVLQSGRIRAIAVTTPARTSLLPDLPTIGESVPGFGVSNWAGLFVPKGTPLAIRERLFKELTEISRVPEVRSMQNRAGIEVSLSGSMDEFMNQLREDTRQWDKVIKAANIKGE